MEPAPPPTSDKQGNAIWCRQTLSVLLLSTAIVVSGFLVFLGFWINSRSEKDRFCLTPAEPYVYMLDRKTGEVWMFWKIAKYKTKTYDNPGSAAATLPSQ